MRQKEARMTDQPPELSAIVERLERLEKQNRRLKRGGLAGLVLLASTLLAGFTVQRPAKPAAVTETLEAQRFVLKNARGETRAQLACDKDNPHLALFDTAGHVAAQLSASPVGPSLTLYDAKGQQRASLGLLFDTSSLMLFNAEGEHRAQLSLMGDQPFLDLIDGTRDKRIRLGVDPDGPSLQISDAAGFMAIVGTIGLETTKTGEAHRTSAASVVLFDKDGKVTWRAP